jgi:hypothetical protein
MLIFAEDGCHMNTLVSSYSRLAIQKADTSSSHTCRNKGKMMICKSSLDLIYAVVLLKLVHSLSNIYRTYQLAFLRDRELGGILYL